MATTPQQPVHPLAAPYETAQILRRRLRAAVKGRDEVIDRLYAWESVVRVPAAARGAA